MLRRLALCAAIAMAAPASAQSNLADVQQRFTPTEMHETGLDTLSPAQLAALNRLLREKAVPANPPASAQRRTDGDTNRGYIGLDDTPIHSRVKGTVEGWEPGAVFVLENGQRWKVLKGTMKLRKSLQAPDIVVVPGIAGRWFLQVDEDMPKARVYRID